MLSIVSLTGTTTALTILCFQQTRESGTTATNRTSILLGGVCSRRRGRHGRKLRKNPLKAGVLLDEDDDNNKTNKSDEEEEEKEVEMMRKSSDSGRGEALRSVDEQLSSGKDNKALAIVQALRSVGGLRGFEIALQDQIPKRIYYLEDLRLNNIEPSRFLSPVDLTLGAVRSNLQLAALLGALVIWRTGIADQLELLMATILFLLLGTLDQLANGGGIEALLLDTVGRLLSPKYRSRVAHHEAGHFLIAYLLGILPKSYALSSLDAFRKDGSLNIQAGTTFVDFAFEEEVKSGRLSSEALDKFTCIALAGVAAEYLMYGVAEGGLADIQQLDNLFKGLKFTQLKADSQVRWAILNVLTLLRRNQNVLSELAKAMDSGRSIGDCICVIEENFTCDP